MSAYKEPSPGEAPAHSRRPGPSQGFQYSGIFGKITYSFVNPLLRLGALGAINGETADDFFPEKDRAEPLCAKFEAAYAAQIAKASPSTKPSTVLWRTFFVLYRWRLLEHLMWCILEIGVRVGNPLLLRQLLNWFSLNAAGGTSVAPTWKGWMWAGIMAAFSYTYVLMHHQLFWRGMRIGMHARMQSIAAVEAKALRLNAAAVADVTGGRIVNVVSNDVRRFDEAGTFWVFLIGGPIELVLVLVLVGLRLNFAASVAGVATLLLLIPAQAMLARYIGHLRAATAAQTDERVRLTGEAISGILACKMLAWEGPLLEHIRAIRSREAFYIRRMNAIRALNMAISYGISPIMSVITFATARGTGAELTVANVFYSLALLNLLKLSIGEFFVHGVECTSELRVTVRRLADFLATPEPPAPWHEQAGTQGEGGQGSDDAIIVRDSDYDWESTMASGVKKSEVHAEPAMVKKPDDTHLVSVAVVKHEESEKKETKENGHALGAAISPIETVHAAGPSSGSLTPSPTSSVTASAASLAPTLQNLNLRVRKGELIGIVGPVGAGKSSILSTLLGELQPCRVSDPALPAVEVRGNSVAYCQQIPWIMSGTVRQNILFGLPYDEVRFNAAVHAAALDDDLRGMPAGVDTEIGERGISISGGQKARLSLARAAYSQAEVQLLDDPLSAVDPRVGRTLFQRCIGPGGLMDGAARILVTHQKQYLPRCDRILVVRGGKIVEEGTFEELAKKKIDEVVIAEGEFQ